MAFTESEVIELLAGIFATDDKRLHLGIGDDAAFVQGFAQQVLTTDIAVEGVHFKKEWSSAYEIGQRVAIANIADVMSMNGRCDYLLVAASLTGNEDLEWIRSLARGIADAARDAGAIVVGGDLSISPVLQLAITAVGHCEKVITRSGATPGDGIYLSSLTGWSAAGLAMLKSDKRISEKAITRFKVPVLDYAIDFSAATSMADVSDAVIVQSAQMAKASGVSFEIDLTLIERCEGFGELAQVAKELGVDVFEWILQGGEDHLLLATGRDLPGILIGTVRSGSGLTLLHSGKEIKMAPVAWSHFDKNY